MARTVQNLFINGGQTFSITVDGLNPVTEVKLFFDGELVPSSLVRQIVTAPTIDYMGPVFNVANFETPTKTYRSGASGVHRFNPRTFEVEFHFPIGPNPHGDVIDQWGYQFAGDGTRDFLGPFQSLRRHGVGLPAFDVIAILLQSSRTGPC